MGDGLQRLGKYTIVRQLGLGGMAEVFEAKLPGVAGFSKTVVIKRILPHLAMERHFVNMFVREAKIASAVQHRNVVQVFELDQTEEGELFLVMEFVRGTDLRHLLGQASRLGLRVPPWFSVYCLSEILDGLSYAHLLTDELGRPRNLVHRDVTPSNIFISHLGEVKLGDFGVARDDILDSQTEAGEVKGKVGYMSPEQLFGRPLDGRVDVFAAGVVLWECLTQKRLYGGLAHFEAMNAIVKSPRIPPSKNRSDVSAELDAITLDALQVESTNRIPSAKAFRARLLEILKKHGTIPAEDVRSVVEALEGKRDANGILDPDPGTGSGQTFAVESSPSALGDNFEDGVVTLADGWKPRVMDPPSTPRIEVNVISAGVLVVVGKRDEPQPEAPDPEAAFEEPVHSDYTTSPEVAPNDPLAASGSKD